MHQRDTDATAMHYASLQHAQWGLDAMMSPSLLQKYYTYFMHNMHHQASAICTSLRMAASGHEGKAREGDFAEG